MHFIQSLTCHRTIKRVSKSFFPVANQRIFFRFVFFQKSPRQQCTLHRHIDKWHAYYGDAMRYIHKPTALCVQWRTRGVNFQTTFNYYMQTCRMHEMHFHFAFTSVVRVCVHVYRVANMCGNAAFVHTRLKSIAIKVSKANYVVRMRSIFFPFSFPLSACVSGGVCLPFLRLVLWCFDLLLFSLRLCAGWKCCILFVCRGSSASSVSI